MQKQFNHLSQCFRCPWGYNYTLSELFKDHPEHKNIGIYDLDMLLEYRGRLVLLGEWKWKNDPTIPAFQYIAQRYIAKKLGIAHWLFLQYEGLVEVIPVPDNLPIKLGQTEVRIPHEYGELMRVDTLRSKLLDLMRGLE